MEERTPVTTQQEPKEYPQRNLKRLRVSRNLFGAGWTLWLISMCVPCVSFDTSSGTVHNTAIVAILFTMFGLLLSIHNITQDPSSMTVGGYGILLAIALYYCALIAIWWSFWVRSRLSILWCLRFLSIAFVFSWTPYVFEMMGYRINGFGGAPEGHWAWGYPLWLVGHLLIALSPWVCPAKLKGEPAWARIVLKRAKRGDPIFDAEYAANRMRAFPVVERLLN